MGEESPAKRGRSKKHSALLPIVANSSEDPVNFLEPFLLIVTSEYCLQLRPAIEDFTVAQASVLAFICNRVAQPKLLALVCRVSNDICCFNDICVNSYTSNHTYSQAKTFISRCTNKTLFSACLEPLWKWVREGNTRVRLAFLMNLEEPLDLEEITDEDEDCPEEQDTTKLFSEMAFEVVNALVLYSTGKSPSGSNEYGFYPYGKEASWSTSAFKKVSNASLALTFAEMYPFLFRPMSKWNDLRKKRAYPMTNLWPHAIVKRYFNFFRAFEKQRTLLFQEYEADEEDGIYHGQEYARKYQGKGASNKEGDDEDVSSDDSMDLRFVR